MRPSHLGLLAAIAALSVFAVSAPARAGGLSDLVGFGAQDVYVDPPAGSPETPAAVEKGSGSPAAVEEGKPRKGKATASKPRKSEQVRVAKACRKAGLKTREDCDAFLAARAKKPGKTLPVETTGAKTTPAETTGEKTAPPDTAAKDEGAAATAAVEANPPATTGSGTTPPAASADSGAPTNVLVMPTATQTGQPSSTSTPSTLTQGQDTGLPGGDQGTSRSPLGVLVQ